MQPRLLLLPGIVLAMTGLPLAAQESQPDAAVVELRETIARIVDTRALESKERQDWEARKNSMATLLDLHRRELELLDEELEKAGQSAGGYDGKKREAEAEIAALREARRTAAEAVARNRPRALALAKRFPAPLADETETERVALEDWKPGGEPRDGLQAILGLVSKAEQFNRRITRSREERDGREAEVLYLGLAAAYYADRSGNAGTGMPGPDGWVWTARHDLHGEIVKAFDQLDRKRPPQLVELPVKLQLDAPSK